MKKIKLLIIVVLVLFCTGCKLTCVKIETNENTINYLRVIVRNKVELHNTYKLNENSIVANNKDFLLSSIKEYVDNTYNVDSVIEDDSVDMSIVLDKDNNMFGEDLYKYGKVELSKYFKEKGYTCRWN